MRSLTVRYERDETGWWVATVKQVRGCHTQGRTIEQAKRRIREALGLFIVNYETVELIDDIRLPLKATRLLKQVELTRKRAADETEKLQHSSTSAAKLLTNELGISIRDAGLLLGLSHQRVHQLLATKNRASAR